MSMKTLEEEHIAFKRAMITENIFLNHNYLRVTKACSPVLNMLGGGNGLYHYLFTDICWLIFLNHELLMITEKTENVKSDFDYSMLRISYKNITEFLIEKVLFWGQHCLKVKTNQKTMYFYIDVDSILSMSCMDFSSVNFRFLLENDFNGLLTSK
ncbi:hypothetical protein [Enterococcus gallinarum]|nr:hypothetical protein [Enterococcus gallinarum]GMG60129.1 hypothetical protein AH4_34700 [Enterococcus gallinarum]